MRQAGGFQCVQGCRQGYLSTDVVKVFVGSVKRKVYLCHLKENNNVFRKAEMIHK